ncbi:glycosyltransferase [Saxibacter everestensis]|uniref:D-inositol 3-phosphate glycosyltransferase n=1 Tax=Saxibacter everestensis TaxID=2909229 RepID=A0ABY8QVX1_9MICO|nr:glycosyltransferase [Brevibacteriaceae bacterium ZFBP1038]
MRARQKSLEGQSGLRVLHAVGEAGGVYGEVATLAINSLPKYGHKVAVAGSAAVLRELVPGKRKDAPKVRKITISLGARPRPLRDLGAVWKLHKLFPKTDVVHAHGLHVGALCALAMTGLPKSSRPALVVTVPRLANGAAVDVEHLAGRLISRRADVVLGATESIVGRFASHGPHTERALLPATDTAQFLIPRRTRQEVRADLKLAEGTWLIASPAKLAETQGLTTLLSAAQKLKHSRPDRSIMVALTGTGPLRQVLEKEFAGRGLSMMVADADSAVDVLSAADVVVTTTELSGLDADQIMQLTRPIVALGGQDATDYYGEAAVIVDEDDEAAVLKAINELVDNPVRRGVGAINARSRVLGSSPAHDVVAQLARLYPAVVRGELSDDGQDEARAGKKSHAH